MGKKFYVLYEHATGYGMVRMNEFEEIGSQLPEIEATVLDPSLFMTACKLVAFLPFQSGLNALENANAISEGVVSDDLRLFLGSNLPEDPKKRTKICLGVSSGKLAQSISEEFCVPVKTADSVPEILRGLQLHFHRMVDGLSPAAERQAQLGLSHAYSRSKVKFNVSRADNMIIQSIALVDQLDKDINIFSMRIREWYGYHFPELYKLVSDNHLFAKAILVIGDRKAFTDESRKKLDDLLLDADKVQAIVDASKSTIGMDISKVDLENIEMFCERVNSLCQYRKELQEYLRSKMGSIAPNLTAIVGEQVGARLISHAGSLTNLAKYPASTIQVLGAEKALFRAIKTKSATPKYGLLFHASLIGRAGRENKGRVSRSLANKCAIASRIDCFSDIPTACYGKRLRELAEAKLEYFEHGCTGDRPPLTSDVLDEASKDATIEREAIKRKQRKKEKKMAKVVEEDEDVDMSACRSTIDLVQHGNVEEHEEESYEKKKRKKKHTAVVDPELSSALNRMTVLE